jgi:hypothetical protein
MAGKRRTAAAVTEDWGRPALIAVGIRDRKDAAWGYVLAIVDGFVLGDGRDGSKTWAGVVNARAGVIRGEATTARCMRVIRDLAKERGEVAVLLQEEVPGAEAAEHDGDYSYSDGEVA